MSSVSSDPSKRHKHMLRIHGHPLRERNEKYRSKASIQGWICSWISQATKSGDCGAQTVFFSPFICSAKHCRHPSDKATTVGERTPRGRTLIVHRNLANWSDSFGHEAAAPQDDPMVKPHKGAPCRTLERLGGIVCITTAVRSYSHRQS